MCCPSFPNKEKHKNDSLCFKCRHCYKHFGLIRVFLEDTSNTPSSSDPKASVWVSKQMVYEAVLTLALWLQALCFSEGMAAQNCSNKASVSNSTSSCTSMDPWSAVWDIILILNRLLKILRWPTSSRDSAAPTAPLRRLVFACWRPARLPTDCIQSCRREIASIFTPYLWGASFIRAFFNIIKTRNCKVETRLSDLKGTEYTYFMSMHHRALIEQIAVLLLKQRLRWFLWPNIGRDADGPLAVCKTVEGPPIDILFAISPIIMTNARAVVAILQINMHLMRLSFRTTAWRVAKCNWTPFLEEERRTSVLWYWYDVTFD